jgi:hypothetical protein
MFLTRALVAVQRGARSNRYSAGRISPGTHWIGSRVFLRAGLRAVVYNSHVHLP